MLTKCHISFYHHFPNSHTLNHFQSPTNHISFLPPYKKVSCCTITDASDHFPIYVDVTIGNSSLPLLEENVSLGTYNVVAENYQ